MCSCFRQSDLFDACTIVIWKALRTVTKISYVVPIKISTFIRVTMTGHRFRLQVSPAICIGCSLSVHYVYLDTSIYLSVHSSIWDYPSKHYVLGHSDKRTRASHLHAMASLKYMQYIYVHWYQPFLRFLNFSSLSPRSIYQSNPPKDYSSIHLNLNQYIH